MDEKDTALIISSSGCNIVPVEMAELFQQQKYKSGSIGYQRTFGKKQKQKKLMGKN